MMVIGDLLRSNARRIPEREALVCDGNRLSWEELNRSTNRLANGLLASGVRPGDRVAFILGNTVEIVQLYYAVAKIGATAVPIMPRSVAREIRHVVTDVAASTIVAAAGPGADAVAEALAGDLPLASVRLVIGVGEDHRLPADFAEIAAGGDDDEPPVAVDPDSIYAIQFTSGTTGAPKGCVLPHRNKVLSRLSMLSEVSYAEDDRALLFMPLAASLGADMLHTHALRGMTTVLMSRFDAGEMLRLIEAEWITALYALESTFDRLIEHPNLDRIDWSVLRWFFASSASRDLRAGMARLAGLPSFRAKVWNAYGCTEGGGWLTFLAPDETSAWPDGGHGESYRSIGREWLLATVDCVDPQGDPLPAGEVGEMVLSAPWLFAGYWGMPEKTAEVLRDGRYFTGDLARKDENGFVFLEGRMTDMIKTGGLSVYPAEIELVLKGHPAVREVAVVGVTDADWGEKVVACVISDDDAGDASELIAYCRGELAGYKVPKSIVFMADFPRDQVGKIRKRELRSQLA